MDQKELENKTINDLRIIAATLGLQNLDSLKKSTLISTIINSSSASGEPNDEINTEPKETIPSGREKRPRKVAPESNTSSIPAMPKMEKEIESKLPENEQAMLSFETDAEDTTTSVEVQATEESTEPKIQEEQVEEKVQSLETPSEKIIHPPNPNRNPNQKQGHNQQDNPNQRQPHNQASNPNQDSSTPSQQ